ncbi:DUF1152 domain-containing protein [Magnetococcales bacterium HHB-1]
MRHFFSKWIKRSDHQDSSDALYSMLPSFLQKLASPEIRTVMLCGCGGGFDFVHGMLLYPLLQQLGIRVIIGSYSFGHPRRITNAKTVFSSGGAIVKQVTAQSQPALHYGPEVHLCRFLDHYDQHNAPHTIYAYYARAFCVPVLSQLYQQLIEKHHVDAILLIDGGTDSLMRGDEEGLGDPIEDAVSIATVADLIKPKVKILVTVGFGADRFNHVSDAASLRAVAELTQQKSYLGAMAIEPGSVGLQCYKSALAAINRGHGEAGFRSIIAGTIVAASEGAYGSDKVPVSLQKRIKPGELYLWPLMAMLWGFDIEGVAKRSLITDWIRHCHSVQQCHDVLRQRRLDLSQRRGVENIPRHEAMRYQK